MRVGRTTRVITTDTRRDNPFLHDGSHRRFMVSIYYPTPDSNSSEHESAYPELFDPGVGTAKAFLTSMGADLDYLYTLKTNVYKDADIMSGTLYPIIIYSPAFGIERDMYWFNIKKLVADGYVVLSIGATYESVFTVFPDGEYVQQLKSLADLGAKDREEWLKLLEIRTQDIQYVMNWLEEVYESDELLQHQIDPQNISLIGHSLGGAAVYRMLQDDSNIKAAILLDPSLHLMGTDPSYVHIPVLLLRQHSSTYEMLKNDGWNEELARDTMNGQMHVANVLTGYKSFIKIHGANHITFSDVPIHFNETQIDAKHEAINKVITLFLTEFVHNQAGEYTNNLTEIMGISQINSDGTMLEES
ncbi:alpha/beta hydrolase family protein [Paenibacillus mendelii]|uniref:Alpha/beta hydrolase family protein n=1 Tax=Paenibacillus mendelii TaxID=206163 RepID=A0ABV6JF02_9BACL|nr:hypothetical protein [Paenibacillus mendelii]MCQ6557166.1 hypothetical protein [Paenibacillus mendelii]